MDHLILTARHCLKISKTPFFLGHPIYCRSIFRVVGQVDIITGEDAHSRAHRLDNGPVISLKLPRNIELIRRGTPKLASNRGQIGLNYMVWYNGPSGSSDWGEDTNNAAWFLYLEYSGDHLLHSIICEEKSHYVHSVNATRVTISEISLRRTFMNVYKSLV